MNILLRLTSRISNFFTNRRVMKQLAKLDEQKRKHEAFLSFIKILKIIHSAKNKEQVSACFIIVSNFHVSFQETDLTQALSKKLHSKLKSLNQI